MSSLSSDYETEQAASSKQEEYRTEPFSAQLRLAGDLVKIAPEIDGEPVNIQRVLVLPVLLSVWFVAGSAAQQGKVPAILRTGSVLSPPTTATSSSDAESDSSTVTVGWDQRWRNEEWNNVFDYSDAVNDERVQNTFRQRLWATILGPAQSLFNVRLLNQFSKVNQNGDVPVSGLKFNSNEVIVDNLYLTFNKLPVKDLSLSAGRKDLMFGEGFLVMDGSATDGPRTNYLNTVDFTYARHKRSLDVLGILDPRQDHLFPILHNQRKNLNEWNEQAVGFYYQDRSNKKLAWDAYYFLKKEVKDYRPATNALFQPDRHIETLGARVVDRLPRGVSVTSEFSYQFGAQHSNVALARPAENIRAWGGFAYVKKAFATKYKPYAQVGYYALSGDDPKTTGTNEAFDPLFSRWPKWSGGYVWSFEKEKGDGYWSNLKMPQIDVGFTPVKPLTLKSVTYFMSAFHPATLANNAAIFSTGTYRGTLPEVLALYKFSDVVNGEFRYELTEPGSFYVHSNKGQYFRFELNYSWKKNLSLNRNY